MARRILLLTTRAVGVLFACRGKHEALLVRVAGPDLPADVKTVGAGFVPELSAFGVILESDSWTDLALPNAKRVNNILVLEQDVAERSIHFTVVPDPVQHYPACAIKGYDSQAAVMSQGEGQDGQPRAESAARETEVSAAPAESGGG